MTTENPNNPPAVEFELNFPASMVKEPPKPQEPPVEPTPPAEPPKEPEPQKEPILPAEGNDIFGDLIKVADKPAEGESNDPYLPIISALELSLPEGKEKWDTETLVEVSKNKIETSRQQLDLTKYDPEVKLLFDYVQENGGTLMGLPMDPTIRQLNELTLYDPEYFFRVDQARILSEQGFDEDEIKNFVETKISKIPEEEQEEYFDKYQKDKIKAEINPRIMQRVEQLNKEKLTYRERLKEANKAEEGRVRESMVKIAEKISDFVGIPLTDAHKQGIISRIKSGDIAKEIEKDPATYQLMGYMAVNFGTKATEVYRDIIKNGGQSRYHQGVMSALDQVYGKQGAAVKAGDKTEPDPKKMDWGGLNSLLGY